MKPIGLDSSMGIIPVPAALRRVPYAPFSRNTYGTAQSRLRPLPAERLLQFRHPSQCKRRPATRVLASMKPATVFRHLR